MKTLIFLLLVGIHSSAAVIHSLKYFFTGSSNVPSFPEFVIVGLVDEVQMFYYDSNTRKAEPKQDWMSRVTADDPQYLERQSSIGLGFQQTFKANIETVKQRMNQTGGIHTYQWMYGCEWDDENGDITGHWQYGYDGEDFISLDMNTWTNIAPTPQAVITKHKWDNNKAQIANRQNYLTQICPDWLKKYINYGRSSLLRTVPPSVSLLQKSPSSPVSCHATGFYPNRAEMFWRKDGEEIHEDVDKGEILPNHDGTFQMRVDLKLPSVKPEDREKYECVFQLSGVKDDIVTKLKNEGSFIPIVVGVVVALLLLVAVCVGAVFISKKYNNGFKRANSSETSSADGQGANEAQQMMNQ